MAPRRVGGCGGMVICRPLGATDGETWQRIFESVAAEGRWIGAEAPVPNYWYQSVIERYLDQQDRALFLAQMGDTSVGWITVEIVEDNAAELGMGVIEAYRHQGVGTAMMEVAVEWATATGADRMILDVFPDNEAAIGLYKKFGFTEVELKPEAWKRRNGELWDLLRMERDLSVG